MQAEHDRTDDIVQTGAEPATRHDPAPQFGRIEVDPLPGARQFEGRRFDVGIQLGSQFIDVAAKQQPFLRINETACAEVEASCARSGVGLVKLMGRDSGFIASFATLADTQVGLCLIPEVPFSVDDVVRAAERRIERDGSVVIVVAEGAGQHLLGEAAECDASGNRRYADIGIYLRDQIKDAFGSEGRSVNIKYIDPSYMIRSLPANARDGNFCLRLGNAAVHAGMAGNTGTVVGSWRRRLTHVPIPLAVSSPKRVDIDGYLWQTVLAVTGQDTDLVGAAGEK